MGIGHEAFELETTMVLIASGITIKERRESNGQTERRGGRKNVAVKKEGSEKPVDQYSLKDAQICLFEIGAYL